MKFEFEIVMKGVQIHCIFILSDQIIYCFVETNPNLNMVFYYIYIDADLEVFFSLHLLRHLSPTVPKPFPPLDIDILKYFNLT